MQARLLIGPASGALGARLASCASIPVVSAEVREFPDGEFCLRAAMPRDLEVAFILQGTYPPQDRHLAQLHQLVEIAAHARARRIVCLTPYLAYARQDRRMLPGEPMSALIAPRTLRALGAAELLTVDVHNPAVFGPDLALINLSSAPALADFLLRQAYRRPVVVSPDRGGEARARRVAERTGWPIATYEKHKDLEGRTWYEAGQARVCGRHAVVVDDLCSSGSTLMPLVEQLRAEGVLGISICIVHFFADAAALQARLGRDVELICTDSIASAPAQVSLAELLAAEVQARLPEAVA